MFIEMMYSVTSNKRYLQSSRPSQRYVGYWWVLLCQMESKLQSTPLCPIIKEKCFQKRSTPCFTKEIIPCYTMRWKRAQPTFSFSWTALQKSSNPSPVKADMHTTSSLFLASDLIFSGFSALSTWWKCFQGHVCICLKHVGNLMNPNFAFSFFKDVPPKF